MDEPLQQSDWQHWLGEQAPRFLLFARQRARTEADAQDLVQEALVEACGRGTGGLPPAPALVFATIRRRAIDLARSEDRRVRRENAEPMPSAWFDPAVEEREQAAIIQDAMSKLPDIYREVITLKVWGELTFAEIATTLEIPANTAASRYRYALEEMRKLTRQVLT